MLFSVCIPGFVLITYTKFSLYWLYLCEISFISTLNIDNKRLLSGRSNHSSPMYMHIMHPINVFQCRVKNLEKFYNC